MILEIENDEDFLSQVAQAEATALSSLNSTSSKRRRDIDEIDNSEKRKIVKMAVEVQEEEGAYTAALRGSKSVTWQRTHLNKVKAIAPPAPTYNRFNGGGGGDDESVPKKKCPCGVGPCVVFTANTERNRGRKFYKCPVRQENGGCGFFEWCDNASRTFNAPSAQNFVSHSTFSDLPCPCGAGSCLVLTAKTGKNVGQQFYTCPANQASSCGFFKWCTGNAQPASLPSTNASYTYNSNNNNNMDHIPNNKSSSYGVRSGYSCFKCGNDGRCAKDCSSSTSESGTRTQFGGRSVSSGASGTCYKCGQPGHWARDCTSAYNTILNKY